MKNSLNNLVQSIEFDFVKNSKFAFSISLFLISVIIFLFVGKGLNLGVDFTGGMIFELTSQKAPFDLADIRKKMTNESVNEATVQFLNNRHELLIRLKEKQGADKIKGLFAGQDVTYERIDYVGPQVSTELMYKGMMATVAALLGMLLYLLIRFHWSFAISGVLALMHDIILSIGFFILMGMEFNIPSIAALLTIIGYSINDSVVIFDRVREYSKNRAADKINQAIHSTLTRTILTSVTTMLAALPLVILGKGVLYDFSLVILFGVFVGTYSSIFIAGPLLARFTGSNQKDKHLS